MLESNLQSNSACDAFRKLADSIRFRAARFGKTVRGYHNPELPLFRAAAPERQAQILASLRLLDDSLDTEDEDVFFEAEKRALWKSIMLLGFVPPPGLFNELKPDRAIEIFDLNGGVVWRNLTCMDLCSYTLEEIACIGLWERYLRTPGAFEECFAKLQAMLEGRTPDVVFPDMPPYTMIETMSSDRLTLSIQHELACLLKNRQGGVEAWLSMSAAKVLGAGTHPTPPAPHLSLVN